MSRELAIRDVNDLKEMAKTLGASALLPNQLRGKPADVFVTIMYGHELGLSPMAAVQGIYVVNGRPTMSSQTWLALARRAGHRIEVTEHTDQACTVVIVRGDTGERHSSTYTFAEAETAKLTTKDVWKQHRKNMLLARAVANGCRFSCPEIALGYYAEGELFDDEPVIEQATPSVQAPAAPTPAADEPIDAEVVTDELADIAAEFEQPTLGGNDADHV